MSELANLTLHIVRHLDGYHISPIVGRVPQASPFCPNIAATPDGKQVWFTLKDIGKREVFDAQPPFSVLKIIDTGPITNQVNIVHKSKG